MKCGEKVPSQTASVKIPPSFRPDLTSRIDGPGVWVRVYADNRDLLLERRVVELVRKAGAGQCDLPSIIPGETGHGACTISPRQR